METFDVLSCSQGILSRFDLHELGQRFHPLPRRANIFVLRISKLPQIQGRGTRSSSYSVERRKSGSVLRKISRRPDVDAPAIATRFLSPFLSISLLLAFVPFSIYFRPKFHSLLRSSLLRDRNHLQVFRILKSPKSPRSLINVTKYRCPISFPFSTRCRSIESAGMRADCGHV